MMTARITATVANAATLAQQASEVAATVQAAVAAQQLATASKAAREAVTSFEEDFYKRKIFDDCLKFTSDDDKKAYREREEERHRAIDAAKAKNTPEGDLQATRLSIAQLDDAGAHGADRSPQFSQTRHILSQSETALSTAIASSNRSANTPVAKPEADLLDASPSAAVDPAIIASLKSAGVVVADQSQKGHGVTADVTVSNGVQRS